MFFYRESELGKPNHFVELSSFLSNLEADLEAERTGMWRRPKTTRRYLQGPLAERLLVFFREGKILYGDVHHLDDWSFRYRHVASHAVWLVGADDKPFDFKAARLNLSEDGLPEHSQTWLDGNVEITLTACAPVVRKPTAYARLTVKNNSTAEIFRDFALFIRAAKEDRLVFGAPDIYKVYDPKLEDWLKLPADDWLMYGGVIRSNDRFVEPLSDVEVKWDAEKGACRFRLVVPPNSERTFDFAIGKGVRECAGYDAAMAEMRAGWAKELARLTMPQRITDDAPMACFVRHQAVQMLQCLAFPDDGRDFIIPRQGGLQRCVWPGEVWPYAHGLDLLGFHDYVERIIDFFFTKCQKPTGEAGPFRNHWASDTASIIVIFARHCLLTDAVSCWRKYADAAYKGFQWIGSMRDGEGLFPPMRSTDEDPLSFRSWVYTDIRNWMAFDLLAQAASHFGDSRAEEIRAAADDYRRILMAILDNVRAASQGDDELVIPISHDGKADAELNKRNFFQLHVGRLLDAGFVTNEDELIRIRRGQIRRGVAHENGLYSHKSGDIWYVGLVENQWYFAWRRAGRDDLARQVLAAFIRFTSTAEAYLCERYMTTNPWYMPWSPNASASGRLISMLYDAAEHL
ncbi:MAG: hypothetical protein J6X49_03855 [Victivallales bacterium]|nr:hypothetical protein [Victivallales bacterium]